MVAAIRSILRKGSRFQASGVLIALAVLCVVATIASPDIFLTIDNISNLLRQVSVVGVVSVGMTLVLLIGGIDLSVTSVMALSGCIMANVCKSLTASGLPNLSFLLVAGILGIGLAVGFLNGAMIVYRGIEPFIITLGVNQALLGVVFIYTHGAPGGQVTSFWRAFGSGELFGAIPWPVMFLAGLTIVFGVILRMTVFGRYVYAIGSNSEATRLSGIKVNMYKIATYMLSGMTAAMAGIMLAARIRIGEPNGSSGYDLTAIAAVVIGGTAMSGGRGTLLGTLAGALIMAVANNLLDLVNADPFLQKCIKGLIVIVAVLVQRREKK